MVKFFRIEPEIEAFIARWDGIESETFVRVLQEGQGEDRLIAICALGFLAQSWVSELLLPFLQSSDHAARWASALMLGKMKEEQAFPVLVKALTEFLPGQNEELPLSVPALELHYVWRHMVITVLDNWQRPELVSVFSRALIELWNAILGARIKLTPFVEACFHCQDELAYALGRMHALELFKKLPFPPFAIRLAMLQGVSGHLDIRSRYSRSYQSTLSLITALRMYEASLGKPIMAAWEQHFGLSEEERVHFIEICSLAYNEREQLRELDR